MQQSSPRYFIVPGLGNSGPAHWQTYFECSSPDFTRIEQQEWDAPHCPDWVAAIDAALADEALEQVVLIGHSLGCATIAHWATGQGRRVSIKGAFLVAPSDVETAHYAVLPTTGFAPMPAQPLPFPSLVVASTNDEWATLARARQFAQAWGSELVDIGPAGHINAASGFGDWPAGLAMLHEWANALPD